MSRSRHLILLLSTLVVWAFGAASAQAGSWFQGPGLGQGNIVLIDSVVVDPAGKTTFAWTQWPTSPGVYIQQQAPNGELEPPERLPDATNAALELTDRGIAAAWFDADSSGTGGKVMIKWMDADGVSVRTTTLATVPTSLKSPLSLAVTPSGDAAVAWLEETEVDDDWYLPPTLRFRRASAGGQLGPLLDLGTAADSNRQAPSLAMTSDGRAYVGWLSTKLSDPNDIWSDYVDEATVARVEPSGELDGSPQVITKNNEHPVGVQLEAGPDSVFASWNLADEDEESPTTTLMVGTVPPTGPIARQRQIVTDDAFFAGTPLTDLYVGVDGTATIAFTTVNLARGSSLIYVSRISKNGAAGEPIQISAATPGVMPLLPSLTPSGDGSLVATWMEARYGSGPQAFPSTGFASREIAADGTLADQISTVPGVKYAVPGYAITAGNGKGDVTMAWSESAGPIEYEPDPEAEIPMQVGTARYDSKPPQIVASIPKKLKRGENGQMSVTATAKSGIAEIEWDFGDGSFAKGASVRHAYGRTGDYEVTVTATDKGGTSSTISRKINVYEPSLRRAPARLKLTKVVRKKRLVKINGKISPRASGKIHITWKQKTARKTIVLKRQTKISKGRFKATVRLNGPLAVSKAPGKLTVSYGGNKKTLPARASRAVRA